MTRSFYEPLPTKRSTDDDEEKPDYLAEIVQSIDGFLKGWEQGQNIRDRLKELGDSKNLTRENTTQSSTSDVGKANTLSNSTENTTGYKEKTQPDTTNTTDTIARTNALSIQSPQPADLGKIASANIKGLSARDLSISGGDLGKVVTQNPNVSAYDLAKAQLSQGATGLSNINPMETSAATMKQLGQGKIIDGVRTPGLSGPASNPVGSTPNIAAAGAALGIMGSLIAQGGERKRAANQNLLNTVTEHLHQKGGSDAATQIAGGPEDVFTNNMNQTTPQLLAQAPRQDLGKIGRQATYRDPRWRRWMWG